MASLPGSNKGTTSPLPTSPGQSRLPTDKLGQPISPAPNKDNKKETIIPKPAPQKKGGGGSSNNLPTGNNNQPIEYIDAKSGQGFSGIPNKQQVPLPLPPRNTGDASVELDDPRVQRGNSISAAKPFDDRTGYNLPLREGVKASAKNIINFKKLDKEGFGSYWGNIFTPLDDVNAYARSRPNINPEYRGTEFGFGMPDSQKILATPPGFQDTSKMSLYELKVNQEILKGTPPDLAGLPEGAKQGVINDKIVNEIQNKIDRGEIKYETDADKKIVDELAKNRYREETDKAYNYDAKGEDNKRIELGKASKFVVETAALSVIVAYPEVKLVANFGKDLALFRTSSKGTAYFKPNAYFEKINRIDVMEDLAKQPFRISGKELFRSEEGAYFKITAERGVPSANQRVTFDMPVINRRGQDVVGITESGQKVVLERGKDISQSFFIKKGKVETNYYSFVTDSKSKTIQGFGGGGKIDDLGKAPVFTRGNFRVDKNDEIETGFGNAYIKLDNKDTFNKFKVFGITKEKETAYAVAGGTQGKIYSSIDSLKITNRGYSELNKNYILRGKINSFGEITKLQEPQFSISGFGTTTKQTFKPVKPYAVQGITEKVGQISIPKNPPSLPTAFNKKTITFISITRETLKTASPLRVEVGQEQFTKLNIKPLSSSATPTLSPIKPEQRPQTRTFSSSSIIQEQIQPPKQEQRFSFTRPMVNSAPYVAPKPFDDFRGFKLKIPKFSFDEGSSGTRGFGYFRRGKYTPSYDAIILGIRGKQTKSPVTLALGTRKIPKRFSYAFNNPRGLRIAL